MLLITARKAIWGQQRPTGLSHALRFVFDDYEPSYFWWEVLEMLRRFVLVGLMSIIPTPNHVGSVVQLVIATLISILYLMFQLQVRPSSFCDLSPTRLTVVPSPPLARARAAGKAIQRCERRLCCARIVGVARGALLLVRGDQGRCPR